MRCRSHLTRVQAVVLNGRLQTAASAVIKHTYVPADVAQHKMLWMEHAKRRGVLTQKRADQAAAQQAATATATPSPGQQLRLSTKQRCDQPLLKRLHTGGSRQHVRRFLRQRACVAGRGISRGKCGPQTIRLLKLDNAVLSGVAS